MSNNSNLNNKEGDSIMRSVNLNTLITIISIIFTFGVTFATLRSDMKNLDNQMKKLTEKVEQHNNFGIRLSALEKEVEIYKSIIEKRLK